MELRRVGGAKPSHPAKLARRASLVHHPAVSVTLVNHMLGIASLPASFDLSPHGPGIFDQGQDGSCVPTSGAGCLYTAFGAQGGPLPWVPSMKVPYGGARARERALATAVGQPVPTMATWGDTGLEVADLIAFYAEYGVTDRLLTSGLVNGLTPDGRFSDLWSQADTGDPAIENINDEPELGLLETSGRKLIVGPYGIDPAASNASDVIAAAIVNGIPVQMAFFCDSAFQALFAGQVAVAPNLSDTKGGGHAVYLNGFQQLAGARVFTLVNSWSKSWCNQGTTLVGSAWLAGAWEAWPYAAVKVAA